MTPTQVASLDQLLDSYAKWSARKKCTAEARRCRDALVAFVDSLVTDSVHANNMAILNMVSRMSRSARGKHEDAEFPINRVWHAINSKSYEQKP